MVDYFNKSNSVIQLGGATVQEFVPATSSDTSIGTSSGSLSSFVNKLCPKITKTQILLNKWMLCLLLISLTVVVVYFIKPNYKKLDKNQDNWFLTKVSILIICLLLISLTFFLLLGHFIKDKDVMKISILLFVIFFILGLLIFKQNQFKSVFISRLKGKRLCTKDCETCTFKI